LIGSALAPIDASKSRPLKVSSLPGEEVERPYEEFGW
jgi:hypothetical protein